MSQSIQSQDEAFRQALKVVPVRNKRVSVSEDPTDSQTLNIEVTLEYKSPIMRLLRSCLKAGTTKKYHLDRMGTQFYRMIDDHLTFEQLIDSFSDTTKLTFFESRALLGQYLQMLTKRGIVVATLPKK